MIIHTQEEYKRVVCTINYIRQNLLEGSFVVEKTENSITGWDSYKIPIQDGIIIYFTAFGECVFNPIDKLIHSNKTYYLVIDCLNLKLFSNDSSFTINNYYEKLKELHILIESQLAKQEVIKRELAVREKRIKGIGHFIDELKHH